MIRVKLVVDKIIRQQQPATDAKGQPIILESNTLLLVPKIHTEGDPTDEDKLFSVDGTIQLTGAGVKDRLYDFQLGQEYFLEFKVN